ncbi:MAG: type 1 glutamine amidotransferase [Rhodocyclaceae bacterium]|nr:type 1 glutamine amidotransferase [Rhodocyclaceae bacterium]
MPRVYPLRIGLSARLMHRVPPELGFRDKTLQYLEQSLAHWIMSHGALAFMVPTLDTRATARRASIRVRDYVHALDGLVLQGGADVSPESYGEKPLRPEWGGDRLRDLYELDLFWEFVIQKKPVLGICRGAQLINVAMGGTLYQDIAERRPGGIRHVDSDLYDELQHRIVFEPRAHLAQLYLGSSEGRVSSIHHQALKDLGSGIRVEARAEDGVVEAIGWEGGSYVFGVQWHPEFHAPDAEGLLDGSPIIEEFLQAARRAGDSATRSGARISASTDG